MRDQFAPMIEGFDLNGIVDPYSFQCTPFYIEGDNGGTLMDGTTIHDILEEKVRLSWTFNALYIDQYTALSDALNSGESPDTVTAYAYDLTRNAVILAKFHASLPEFNFVSAYGQTMALSNGELVLEEAELLAWFVIKPPTRTTYERGETLDLTGLAVMRYDKDGNGVDITTQCTVSPATGTELLEEGEMPVIVTLPSGFECTMDWNLTVTPPVPIASGDWWALYNDGLLDIYCAGSMPDYATFSLSPFYQWRELITKIVFRDSVTTIGKWAFYGCSSLINVTIPDSVIAIGAGAFYSSGASGNLTIPNSVITIGASAFRHFQFDSITIGNTVTTIGDYAFYQCSKITSMTIPDSVTTMGEYAFSYCFNLSNLTIGSGITTIERDSFSHCYELNNVTIPDTVITIGTCAFESCSNLTNITFGTGVTTIGTMAFDTCSALASITIPSNITTIGNGAFEICGRLTNVTLAEGVTTIGNSAFAHSALPSIAIPDSVTVIGNAVFIGCGNLIKIETTANNRAYTSEDGILFNKSKTAIVCYPQGKGKIQFHTYTIPDSVTTIKNSTFYGCNGLTSIIIPDNVTVIEDSAFYNCRGLTSIKIPDSVATIGNNAFNGCSSLTSITIPSGITAINEGAFSVCSSLTSIKIPSRVTTIGRRAFSSCRNLTSVIMPSSVKKIDMEAFAYCNKITDVYYSGTQSQRNTMSIVNSSNSYLTNATWHYNSTGPDS